MLFRSNHRKINKSHVTLGEFHFSIKVTFQRIDLQFFSIQLLVEKFNFHRFDNLVHSEKKSDPRRSIYRKKSSYISTLLFAANKGDTTAIKR